MTTFLLFDSACQTCLSIARRVERASGGRVSARSLRDPEIRALLDRTRPGWRWEPMLLEVGAAGGDPRILRGPRLHLRLARLLGPRRALSVARLMWGGGASPVPGGADRRTLIGRAFASMTALLAFETIGSSRSAETGIGSIFPIRRGSPSIRDARRALRIAEASPELERLLRESGRELVAHPGGLALEREERGVRLYRAPGRSVLYLGETRKHQFYSVVLAAASKGDGARDEELYLAYVDLAAGRPLEILQVRVTGGDGENARLAIRDLAGGELEGVIEGGRLQVTRQEPSPLSGSYWGCVLCALVGSLACFLQCFAICGATSGIGCVLCAPICNGTFILICAAC